MPDGVIARVLRLTPSRLGPSRARRSCPPVRRPGGSVFAAQYPAYAHPCQRSSDSPLEEDGFEPPVPLGSNTSVSTGFAGWRGGRSLFRKAPRLRGDRQFESGFLQRGVRNEPVPQRPQNYGAKRFTSDKQNRGYQLRFGLFEISDVDMTRLTAM